MLYSVTRQLTGILENQCLVKKPCRIGVQFITTGHRTGQQRTLLGGIVYYVYSMLS